jgi:hypothetical protein
VKRKGKAGIRPEEARGACVWEYARESRTLREKFPDMLMNSSGPLTLETSFLSAIRFGMGSEHFLRVPWTTLAAAIRREVSHFREAPIRIERGVYPVKLVKGYIAEEETGHIIVKISLYEDRGEVLKAVGRVYDEYREKIPRASLRGRSTDWLARIQWLEWYRMKRRGLSYRDIALEQTPDAEDEQLESEIRKVKRGVSNVRKIFHELFPFLPLSELI